MNQGWVWVVIAIAVSFVATQSPAMSASTDACQLMSQTEVVQFIGGPAGAAEHPFNEMRSCSYGTTNKSPAAYGSIIYSTMTDADVTQLRERAISGDANCHPNVPAGREVTCALLAKMRLAQNTKDVLAAYGSTPNVAKLAGIGEEALWVTGPGGLGHQLFARSGGQLVQLLVEVKGHEDEDASKRAAQFLVGRLRP